MCTSVPLFCIITLKDIQHLFHFKHDPVELLEEALTLCFQWKSHDYKYEQLGTVNKVQRRYKKETSDHFSQGSTG